jgi:hypothetical protein
VEGWNESICSGGEPISTYTPAALPFGAPAPSTFGTVSFFAAPPEATGLMRHRRLDLLDPEVRPSLLTFYQPMLTLVLASGWIPKSMLNDWIEIRLNIGCHMWQAFMMPIPSKSNSNLSLLLSWQLKCCCCLLMSFLSILRNESLIYV